MLSPIAVPPFRSIALLTAACAMLTVPAIPARAQAAGTVKGFVRVNGATVVVKNAYTVSAPDGFDPSKEVKLILLTPAPITAAAWGKAASRTDVFGLVGGSGAIVEINPSGHYVYIQHAALKGQQLQTGGGFPVFKTANNRISGDVSTFMPGDKDEFGFKVRFELAFDAPIVKTIPLGKPFVPTPPPAPKPVPAGPAPTTKADAVKWLQAQSLNGGDPTSGLVSYFVNKEAWSVTTVRAFLLAGATPAKPDFLGGFALNTAALMCEKKPDAPEIVKLLVDAGANVNQKDKDGPQATPPMLSVRCPDVLKVLLAAKPDLNLVDVRGHTVMHHALTYGSSKVTAPMIRDAGFDLKRWNASLKEAYLEGELKEALAAPVPAPRATPPPSRSPAPPSPPVVAPPASAPRVAVDWKAVGPYPQRSKAEAVRLLSKPGADTTADDHFWDGINSHEPQRLALAILAGANLKATRVGSGYTPLIAFAEGCEDRNPEPQIAIVEQLLAAGVDLNGVDANKANALTVGALHCPLAAINAMIKAGVNPHAVSAGGNTALKTAILAGRVDVVEALLDAGVDLKKEPYNPGKMAAGNKAMEAALKKKRK